MPRCDWSLDCCGSCANPLQATVADCWSDGRRGWALLRHHVFDPWRLAESRGAIHCHDRPACHSSGRGDDQVMSTRRVPVRWTWAMSRPRASAIERS